MYCPRCGYQNMDGANVCSNCGMQLNPQWPPVQQPLPPQQAGTQKNVSALLTYVLGWLTGIIFLLIEKDRFVKFHAVQSIITFGALTVLRVILGLLLSWGLWRVLVIYTLLSTALNLGTLVLWIVLMVKAYKGEWLKLPVIGDMAEKYSS